MQTLCRIIVLSKNKSILQSLLSTNNINVTRISSKCIFLCPKRCKEAVQVNSVSIKTVGTQESE